MLDGGTSLPKIYGSGTNYAPLKPLLELESHTETPKHYLNDFAKEVYDDCIRQDDGAWREVLEQGRVISNLESGKLIIKRDPMFHELILLQPQKKTSNRRGVPIFQFYMSNLAATWSNSNPDIDPVIEGDDDRADLAVSAVKQVHNYYERVIFNETYNRRECSSALTYGTYITKYGYNELLRQIQMLKPVIENKSLTLYEGYGACLSCSHEGKDSDFTDAQTKAGSPYPMCPECGSTEAIIDPSLEINGDVVTGHESIQVGDLQGDLLAFPACRYNMRKFAEDSEYFIYEQFLPIRMLKGMLGNIEISEADATGSLNYGHLILEALATRGGSIEDQGRDRLFGNYNSFKEQALVTEMWLKPEMYADVVIQGDEKTVSGEKLQKGGKLIDVFPNGVCFVGLNQMQTVLAIYGENHSDCIVSGIYHLQSHSGIGKGVSDAVDVYKDMNLLHSKAMSYIERFSTPSYGYAKGTVTEELAQQIGDPTINIPFDFSQIPEGMRSIQQLVQPLMSGTPNPALFQYGQQLHNMFQLAMQVTEFSDGLPGVRNNTATGAEITKDNARKQSIPALKLKAEHRKSSAPKIINLFRQIPAPRWFSKQDRFGVVKGKYIFGEELPKHISWEAVANSEVPQNEYDERQSAAELFAQTGGLPGFVQLAEMSPRWGGWAAKKYKVDAPITTEDDIAKVCRMRVDDITALAQEANEILNVANAIVGMQPDTSVVVDAILAKLKRPLAVAESAHTEKAAWLSELLDADELNEDQLLRECIQRLIENHMKAQIYQQYKLQELAQEVEAGLAEQAQEAAQPMMDQQNAQAAQQQDTQFQQEQASKQADAGQQAQQQQVQSDQQTQQMELKHQQDLEKTGIDIARDDRKHEQQMELAKFNAKAKPATPAKKK
jgi:hypothetical protein